jgi:lysophospholipase L1-like esterase
LFADAGSVTPKSNPFSTDASGYGSFYVVGGRYRIQATDIDWRNEDLVSQPDLAASIATNTAAILDRVIRVTSVAAIEALSAIENYQVSLSGSKAGIFEFNTSNLSSEVTADPSQYNYIAPSGEDGSLGAWVRQVEAYNNTTSGLTSSNLQAAIDEIASSSVTLDENALALNNGDVIAPFTGDTGSLSVGTGELELTGTGSVVTMPVWSVGDEQLLVYGSFRSDVTTEFCNVRVLQENGANTFFFFNYNIDTDTREAGSLSVRAESSFGSVVYSSTIATGLDFTVDYKFLLNFYKEPEVSAGDYHYEFFDATGSGLVLLGTVPPSGGTSSTGSPISAVGYGNDTSSYTGTTFIQYLQVSRANFSSIGDSVTAGHNAYDPDPSVYGGVDDYDSTWQQHLRAKIATAFPTLRNNFVANQGVGGNSSDEVLARELDVLRNASPVVIYGGTNNDFNIPLSYGERNSNIGQVLRKAKDSGALTLNLAAIVPNTSSPNYPQEATYYDDWNENYSNLGVSDLFVDIMESGIRQAGERYISPSFALDKVHPNVAGYTLIGNYIGDQLTPLLTVV